MEVSRSNQRSRIGMWTAVVIGIVTAVATAQGHASVTTFQDMQVEVVGEGRPLLMIPGLNSSAEVWRETCQSLQPGVQCHMVQLPGFAGLAPVSDRPWLDAMRDRLLNYVDDAGLKSPSVIGHSLGGVLALELTRVAPERFERAIIVDALPFLGAARNPAATAEGNVPMAEAMRRGMLDADEASYKVQAKMGLVGMSNDPARMPTLVAWGEQSDRATTAQAFYELLTTDLRPQLGAIKTPTLVLGAWASYAAYGATRESTLATIEQQYLGHPALRIELSDSGYHFLMWDDPSWLQQQVRDFLKQPDAKRH